MRALAGWQKNYVGAKKRQKKEALDVLHRLECLKGSRDFTFPQVKEAMT
jgi:hypothetical protein